MNQKFYTVGIHKLSPEQKATFIKKTALGNFVQE